MSSIFCRLLIVVCVLRILVYIFYISAEIRLEANTPISIWTRAKSAMNERELYGKDFDVDEVLLAMRNSKIIAARIMHMKSSFKMLLQLEGGQRTMFKAKFP